MRTPGCRTRGFAATAPPSPSPRFIALSVLLGRRAAAGKGAGLDRAASALALVAIVPAAWHMDSPPRAAHANAARAVRVVYAPQPGLAFNGVTVSNIFPFDRDGKPLNDVLLYLPDGQSAARSAAQVVDPNRRYLVTRRGGRLYNSFPVRYFDPGTSLRQAPERRPARAHPGHPDPAARQQAVTEEHQEHAHRGDAFVRKLVTFGRILREAGLEVGPGRMQDALLGLAAVDLANRDDVYWALRCTIVSRRDDIEVFDAAFAAFWERAPRIIAAAAPDRDRLRAAGGAPEGRVARGRRRAGAGARGARRRGSRRGGRATTRRRPRPPSGRPTSSCATAISPATGPMSCAAPGRSSHASRASRRAAARCAGSRRRTGRTFDPRRTLREAMRTGGVPIERAWREPKLVPRKLVYLVDVSGSMEPYARAMVMFLQAAVRAGRHVEAFTFGTRLTRLTPHLAGRDPDRALANAARAVPDWAGGTRIGENLKAFNDVWGRRGTDARRDRRDRLGRLGARRPIAARRADAAPAPGGAPHRLDESRWPAARATGRSSPACRPRCRTSTTSCPATTCARSRRWPRCWRRSTRARGLRDAGSAAVVRA